MSFLRHLLPLCLLLSLLGVQTQHLDAQDYYLAATREPALDSIQPYKLGLSWQAESFFRNNEYNSSLFTGYTLPGYRLSATFDYRVDALHGARLSVGAYSLQYWGASRYPAASAYRDIGYWSDLKSRRGIRVLPFVRAEIKPGPRSILVLGSIYGGASHRLIEPLYNPELNLTADPENGLQYRYQGDRLTTDLWIDWQSFIYKRDDHQEAFAAGMHTKWIIAGELEQKLWQMNLSLQGTAVHRGGEYNLTQNDTVHTWLNGAAGLEALWLLPTSKRNVLSASVYALGYSQRSRHYPLDKGFGTFVDVHVSGSHLDAGASYWQARDWVAPLGLPFANGLNHKGEPLPHGRSSYLKGYADLHYKWKHDLSFGLSAAVWYHPLAPQSGISHYLGLYLAIKPSVIFIR